jgi:hypothetical protein
MEAITDFDLQGLETAYNEATKGEWKLAVNRAYRLDEDGYARTIFEPYSNAIQHVDIAFAVTAHELVPALVAEVRRLRRHLNPPPDASDPEDAPIVQQPIRCPSCGSTGPLTKASYVLADREFTSYTCGCGEHFQPEQ